MSRPILLSLAAVIVLLGLATVAPATEVVLSSTMDVYVDSANPSLNFGGGSDLYLGKGTYWGLGYFRAYFQFDLSSLAGLTVDAASLRIYQYSAGPAAGGLPCDAHRVTGTWNESSITWNNKPTHDAQILDSQDVGHSGYQGWIGWTITGLVQDWVDGAVPNQGVVLKHYFESPAGASRYGIFYATESLSAYLPELVVEVSDPAGAETPDPAVERSSWGAVKALFQ